MSYASMQFNILNRKLIEFGLHPVIGYLLGIIVFVAASMYLFYKTDYAHYIYCMMALGSLRALNQKPRIEFLKNIFQRRSFYFIRINENLFVSLPFCGFLLYKGFWSYTLGTIFVASLMALTSGFNSISKTLPTPFHQFPFEFAIGFRSTYLIYFISWFLMYMSYSVGNFNLGLFTLILTFLLCCSYSGQLEPQQYIWIFNSRPSAFLKYKVQTSILYATVLSLPLLIALLLVFPIRWPFIVGVQGLGYLYLTMIILAKYSGYPRSMSVPQTLLITFTLILPPLLFLAIPYFYSQSNQRLQPLLS